MSEAVWHVADVKTPATADGIVIGTVWFTLHGVDFPEAGWTDFPISVLSSAVTAYEDIRSGELEAFSYIFDGPYFLYYRRTDASEPTVCIEANCDRDENAVVSLSTGEVPLRKLRGTLLSAVETLHAEIAAKPCADDSVHIAARLIATLSGQDAISRREVRET